MPKSRFFRLILITFIIAVTISAAYSYEDGFGQAKKIESKYFTIYYAPQLDTFDLAQQLNVGAAERILAGRTARANSSRETELTDMMDTLFLRAGEILDMNLFSYKGIIKICRDKEHLNGIYRKIFNKDLRSPSLYIYTLNTIYICPEDFKIYILGHEIAHAIISNYFVVQPPEKVAEILSGYVEYQLRKVAN
ncbi:MAG: hypothetical protein A2166_05455 [Omnitrophica WOR_2 bacterium RBG_13_41_10]|nr:MAG: hypothetical protein A2166_05455 [Omnitrophica WOR_2 bacterium RBG_13_41_10]